MKVSREYLHLKICLLDMVECFAELLPSDNGCPGHLRRIRAIERSKSALEHSREVQRELYRAESEPLPDSKEVK